MRKLFDFLIQAYGAERVEAVMDAIALTAGVTIIVLMVLI